MVVSAANRPLAAPFGRQAAVSPEQREDGMSDQTRSVIIWVVIGLIAGWLASVIVGSGAGLIGYIIAGLIGSVVGGFLAQQLKIKLNLGNQFVEQLIISVVGAIIVLIIARIIT
jgi:uncharacterized membrane protein YeaQ/YmgE (transglycosylase-associated protein family)